MVWFRFQTEPVNLRATQIYFMSFKESSRKKCDARCIVLQWIAAPSPELNHLIMLHGHAQTIIVVTYKGNLYLLCSEYSSTGDKNIILCFPEKKDCLYKFSLQMTH